MPCPDPRRERGRVQTERGGGNGPGLPKAGEYEIPAAGTGKTLLVLVVNVGHLVKVLVLFWRGSSCFVSFMTDAGIKYP
jgi:hypothetical protein